MTVLVLIGVGDNHVVSRHVRHGHHGQWAPAPCLLSVANRMVLARRHCLHKHVKRADADRPNISNHIKRLPYPQDCKIDQDHAAGRKLMSTQPIKLILPWDMRQRYANPDPDPSCAERESFRKTKDVRAPSADADGNDNPSFDKLHGTNNRVRGYSQSERPTTQNYR